MHRAQMSLGTIRSVAQHAHVQTVSVHWPSTGIGTFSSDEQVQLSPVSLASHCAMAVYWTLHFVTRLAVASAAFTQLAWQSGSGQSPGACAAHIAVQDCARVGPVPEPPVALPPEPLFPPAPPAPPDRGALAPPFETVPPDTREPPVAAVPPVTGIPPVAAEPPVTGIPPVAVVPPLAGTPPFATTPPAAIDPPEAAAPPLAGDPPVEAGGPPLLSCEQAVKPRTAESASRERERVEIMVVLLGLGECRTPFGSMPTIRSPSGQKIRHVGAERRRAALGHGRLAGSQTRPVQPRWSHKLSGSGGAGGSASCVTGQSLRPTVTARVSGTISRKPAARKAAPAP